MDNVNTVEPLDQALADVLARYRKGQDYLTSAAIALRNLRTRVEAGEAGPGWDWPRYCSAHLTPHLSKVWIKKQLQLAPPGATEQQVQAKVDQRREKNAADERDRRQRQSAANRGYHVVSPQGTPQPVTPASPIPGTPQQAAPAEPDEVPPPMVFPEFPEEAEAIEKEGAMSGLVRAVRIGFITYSDALKLMRKPPETQDRAIGNAELKWCKVKREKKLVHRSAHAEAAVNLLAGRLSEEDFRRFVDLLRRAHSFSCGDAFTEPLSIEAQKRGIVVEEVDEEDEAAGIEFDESSDEERLAILGLADPRSYPVDEPARVGETAAPTYH